LPTPIEKRLNKDINIYIKTTKKVDFFICNKKNIFTYWDFAFFYTFASQYAKKD